MLAVAVTLTMAAGVLSGILPALLGSSTPASGLMGSGSRGTARGGRNIPGAALVSLQISIALVLVCGATLLLRNFQALVSRDLGFSTNVATAEATVSAAAFRGDTARQYAYWTDLRRRLHEIPGVTHVGIATWTPLATGGTGSIEIEERVEPKASSVTTTWKHSAIKLISGRMLSESDNASGTPVTLINEKVAKHFWPNEERDWKTRSLTNDGVGVAKLSSAVAHDSWCGRQHSSLGFRHRG